MHDNGAEIVSVVESDDNPRRRHRELKLGFGLRNPFKRKQVRIVDKRQSPHQGSIDMEDRGRSHDRPRPSARSRRYIVSPGGTIREVFSSRREEPRVEYISPYDAARYRRVDHPESPAVEVIDSGDESPPLGQRQRCHTMLSDEEDEENFERLEAEAREAREDASYERHRRRQAERTAERARFIARDERDRRYDAERHARRAEARAAQAEARRTENAREAAEARDRSRERRRRAAAVFPASTTLRRYPSFEWGEDLRDEIADPGARLILRAQQAQRHRDRSRRRSDRIIYDDDDSRGGFRWR